MRIGINIQETIIIIHTQINELKQKGADYRFFCAQILCYIILEQHIKRQFIIHGDAAAKKPYLTSEVSIINFKRIYSLYKGRTIFFYFRVTCVRVFLSLFHLKGNTRVKLPRSNLSHKIVGSIFQ